MTTPTTRTTMTGNRDITILILATIATLLVPLTAMRFTDEVAWDAADFLVAGILLLGAGSSFIVVKSRIRQTSRRVVIVLILLAALAYVWAELAVGIFTDLGS